MGDTWYSKTNETIIPGNPDRIKAWWDPLQYLNLAKYLKVFNEYPRDFNPRVHGPYCPWRYYGKREFHIKKNEFYLLLYDFKAIFTSVKSKSLIFQHGLHVVIKHQWEFIKAVFEVSGK
jgi:hypothetical protein